MALAIEAIQKYIFQHLNSVSELTAAVEGVFDQVPQKTEYPFICLGNWEASLYRTQLVMEAEHRMEWQVWSREGGRKQALHILALLEYALNTLGTGSDGFVVVWLRSEKGSIALSEDGRTYKAALQCSLLTQEI